MAGLPGLARTFCFERKGGLRAWWRLRRELTAWAPDWCVDGQGNVKSAMVSLCSGAARRSGLSRADWTEAGASHAATDAAPSARGAHAVDRSLALARHVMRHRGAVPDEFWCEEAWSLGIDQQERAAGHRRCEQFFAGHPGPEVILALSAPNDVRSLSADGFRSLTRELLQSGANVLLLSGPREERLGTLLAHEFPEAESSATDDHLPSSGRVRHWVGQRGLRELAIFFSAAAARGTRLIACDSGPMHLAAACGLAVELLAGPQDPRRTGPWLSQVVDARAADSPSRSGPAGHRAWTLESTIACSPCLKRRCGNPQGRVCLEALPLSAIVRRVTHS